MQGTMAPEDVEKLRFDGVWRPEPWLADDHWRAARYLNDGRYGRREMDGIVSRTRQAAQVRCDELNGPRMDVSAGAAPVQTQNRLL